jgi:hypothetical protein
LFPYSTEAGEVFELVESPPELGPVETAVALFRLARERSPSLEGVWAALRLVVTGDVPVVEFVRIVALVAFGAFVVNFDAVSNASRSGTVEVGATDFWAAVDTVSDRHGTGRVSIGVTPAEVVINATAPTRTNEGTDGANVTTGATIGPSSGPIKGRFTAAAIGPAMRFIRPTETANIARTTVGSNCDPAPLRSSRRATSIE